MSRMERIMGIPYESKKPSSLKYPRDPPAPRYINKQGAIDIARKLKLTTIGKVGLRITNSTSIDAEMMSKYNNTEQTKEVSQKSLMDRRKGLEMARNIVESRVGKCIMETNDYEVRRFNREFEKLLENEDQTKRLMIQKKREFVNHKQKVDHAQSLTRRDGARSPMILSTNDADRQHLPNIFPVGAVQQQSGDLPSREESRAKSRGKSPGYMRPLSCTRDKSHDSAVGETERFLNSPYMRACISNINDEEATNRVLEGIQEANETGSPKGTPAGTPAMSRVTSAKNSRVGPVGAEDVSKESPEDASDSKRPPSQGMSLSKLLFTKKLNEIRETSESRPQSRQITPVPPNAESTAEMTMVIGNAKDNVVETDVKDATISSEQKSSSQGKFVVELIKSESFNDPNSPAILVESFRTEGERSTTPGGSKNFASIVKRLKSAKEDGNESSEEGSKKSKKQAANSLTVAAQIALLRTRTSSRKKRRAKKIASMNARALQLSDRVDLMQDPRFTRLAGSLIPDSSGSTDLYHSKGQFSLPDHVAKGFKSNTSRTKDSKFRNSRNLQNLTRFEELLNSI